MHADDLRVLIWLENREMLTILKDKRCLHAIIMVYCLNIFNVFSAAQ